MPWLADTCSPVASVLGCVSVLDAGECAISYSDKFGDDVDQFVLPVDEISFGSLVFPLM